MTKSVFIFSASLMGLIIAMSAFYTHPAAAQTARNLKCRGCVSGSDIKNKSVKRKDLQKNAVNGAKVLDGSLTAIDLGDEAGVEFVGGEQSLSLLSAIDTVVRSITVTAPKGGFVILSASGTFSFGTNGFVGCSLTTGSALDSNNLQTAGLLSDSHNQLFGMTKGVVVPAGSTTFNLVCQEFSGAVSIFDSDLTAIYAPTRY